MNVEEFFNFIEKTFKFYLILNFFKKYFSLSIVNFLELF